MNDKNAEQFANGRTNIDNAIRTAIARKALSVGSRPTGPRAGAPDMMFSVTVGGNTTTVLFTYEEIEDSHEQLTPEARAKVRTIAAEVARWPVMSSSMASGPTQRDRS